MKSLTLSSLVIKPAPSRMAPKIFACSHFGAGIVILMSGLSLEVKIVLLAGLAVSMVISWKCWLEEAEKLTFSEGMWHLGEQESSPAIRNIAIGFACDWFIVLRIQRYWYFEKKIYFYDQLKPSEWHQLKVIIQNQRH